eukprot:jgi/Phyca11/546721/estExt2_Genewise1Plus.C_PHYCAscaffold_220284
MKELLLRWTVMTQTTTARRRIRAMSFREALGEGTEKKRMQEESIVVCRVTSLRVRKCMLKMETLEGSIEESAQKQKNNLIETIIKSQTAYRFRGTSRCDL